MMIPIIGTRRAEIRIQVEVPPGVSEQQAFLALVTGLTASFAVKDWIKGTHVQFLPPVGAPLNGRLADMTAQIGLSMERGDAYEEPEAPTGHDVRADLAPSIP